MHCIRYKHGSRMADDINYKCYTCNIDSICENCVEKCHSCHDVTLNSNRYFFCECYDKNKQICDCYPDQYGEHFISLIKSDSDENSIINTLHRGLSIDHNLIYYHNMSNETPLSAAEKYDKQIIVQFLIDNGASKSFSNKRTDSSRSSSNNIKMSCNEMINSSYKSLQLNEYPRKSSNKSSSDDRNSFSKENRLVSKENRLVMLDKNERSTVIRPHKETFISNDVYLKNVDCNFDIILGKGGMGTVYKGMCYGTPVAIKEIDGDKNDIIREVNLQRKINHSNVLPVMGVYENRRKIFVVTELCQPLKGKISKNNIVNYALQIAKGMAFIHGKGIIHCDLKPQNIMLQNDVIKIIDFGISKSLSKTITNNCLGYTLLYTSPEILAGKPFSYSSDVYSYGITLIELSTGIEPYKEYDNSINVVRPDLRSDKLKEKIINGLRPSYDKNHILADLIHLCINLSSNKRPSFEEIIHILSEY